MTIKLSDLPPTVRQLVAAQAPSVESATFTVPYPPSANTYWRHVGRKVLISAKGRAYRHRVYAALAQAGSPRLSGKLAMRLLVNPPDRRRRDLDNCLKALWDAMRHGGAYADDFDIDELHMRRGAVRDGGSVDVELTTISKGATK